MDRSSRVRSVVLLCLMLAGVAVVATRAGTAQPAGETRAARFDRMSRDAEARGLADPFKGVTADGTVVPRLFAIESTGVSTAPVQKAAAAFIDHAIQAFGAAGVSDDAGLANSYAHVRTLRLADGPDEVHNRAIARLELRKYANQAASK